MVLKAVVEVEENVSAHAWDFVPIGVSGVIGIEYIFDTNFGIQTAIGKHKFIPKISIEYRKISCFGFAVSGTKSGLRCITHTF